MNFDKGKVTAEVAWVRIRGYLHTFVQVAGFALVLLAVFNAFLAPVTAVGPYAPYRAVVPGIANIGSWETHVADVLLFTVGLALAWWG